jgi:hypothetical protein
LRKPCFVKELEGKHWLGMVVTIWDILCTALAIINGAKMKLESTISCQRCFSYFLVNFWEHYHSPKFNHYAFFTLAHSYTHLHITFTEFIPKKSFFKSVRNMTCIQHMYIDDLITCQPAFTYKSCKKKKYALLDGFYRLCWVAQPFLPHVALLINE